jgi:PhnB protein
MQMNPYLSFNGECEAALKFYERCVGAKIDGLLKYRGTPAAETVPPDWLDKILHARLIVGETSLLASDAPPGHFEQPKGFSVALQVKSPADAERIFRELAEKGKVTMPMQQTFWAPRFGMLVDRFGIPWMVNCEQPA